MFEPVTPVPAQPPDTGIVVSGITPTDAGRWQNGIAWRPERCPTATGFDPCGDTFGSPAGADGSDIVYYRPMAFRVEDRCSTRQRNIDPDRARRQAVAITSWMVARELEQGTLSRANPYISPDTDGDVTDVNAYLGSPAATVVAGGPYHPLVALGLLEESARDAQLGMDPFLHIPVRMVPLLEGALVQSGRLLLTKTGARVVADAGYTGAGPEAGGTPEVQTVTITNTPTGGSFTLTYDGQTTAAIAFNAIAATVEAALEALTNLGPGVTVAGGPGPGTPWTVTFPAAMGNVAQMIATGSFTGGTSPTVAVTTTTPGVAPADTAGDWMYATGPVEVRLDPVNVLPEFVDHLTNEVVRVAERLFAATFDPCTLRAISVDIPPLS